MKKIVRVRNGNENMKGQTKKNIIGVSLAGLAIGLSALIINNTKVEEKYKEPYYDSTLDLNDHKIRDYEKNPYDLFGSPYELSDWYYNPETGEIEHLNDASLKR